jgi:hypothetical protein
MRTTHVRRLAAALAAAGAGVGILITGAPAHAQETSQVSVVHGIPGQDVDVYVNGEATLEGFAPTEVAGPLELAAGSYDIVITEPGGDPEGEPILSVEGAEVPAGANLTLVAHLDEGGEPVLTPFVNDVDPLDAGQARLTVRHTAAAPAVDVRAGEEPVFTELTNPNEASADLAAGTVSADVVLTGTDTVVLGPADLELAEGTSTIAYAIGSADEETLDLVVQTIEGLHTPPDGVPSGTGGLADPSGTGWWLGVAGLGVVLLAAGLSTLRPRRSER